MKNNRFNHRLVLRLAIPMILTNISTPLLGLVDTAVLGHLGSANYLAAVALGSLIFSFIFWGFGFLRMGTTGLTAQAFGEIDRGEVLLILFRAIILALIISGFILLASSYISEMSFFLLESSYLVENSAKYYFEIRIWSAPATLCQYVLLGWFLGRQNVRVPLCVVIVTNLSNIGLDIWFVYYLGMHVEGVALASVISEYLGLLIALLFTISVVIKERQHCHFRSLVNIKKLTAMLMINSHIFIRTWCLIFAFAFFTAQGAKLGSVVLAANAVLLNFQNFMAYALDGFAHAAEALVGKAVGEKNKIMFQQVIATAGLWSLNIALMFTFSYSMFGELIINQLTDIQQVRESAYIYLPFLVAMPLVSFICYVLDGVFIGAMMTKEMRNTMLFSLFMVFFPVWYWSQSFENYGLWLAMVMFMLARGLSMIVVFKRKQITGMQKY